MEVWLFQAFLVTRRTFRHSMPNCQSRLHPSPDSAVLRYVNQFRSVNISLAPASVVHVPSTCWQEKTGSPSIAPTWLTKPTIHAAVSRSRFTLRWLVTTHAFNALCINQNHTINKSKFRGLILSVTSCSCKRRSKVSCRKSASALSQIPFGLTEILKS